MPAKKSAKPAAPAAKKSAKPAAPAKTSKSELPRAVHGLADLAKGETAAQVPLAAPGLTAFGEVREVEFGKLRSNDNVRRIRSPEAQKELNESIKEGGAEDRMEVYAADDGTYPILKGSRRHLALANAGYKPDQMISVIVRPAPRTRAEDRLLGLKSNVTQAPMEWPDLAVAIGEAVGVLDRYGNVLAEEETRKGRESGLYKTVKQAAAELGKSRETIDIYVRASRAPYDDLVQIFRAGGSLAHGEVYAAYRIEDRGEALKHYLRTSPHAWPVTVVPERKRAPGGGRPTNASKGLPLRADAIPGRKKRPEPPKKGGTVWRGDDPPPHKGPHGDPPYDQPRSLGETSPPPSPAPAPAPAPLAPAPSRQVSFLDPPPPPPAPAPATTPAVRLPSFTMVLADELGFPIDLVVFVDAVASHWNAKLPFEEWPEEARTKVETAAELLRQSDQMGEVFS